MRSEEEIREQLTELRGHEDEYDELEEGGEAMEAEERGYVEALEWVLDTVGCKSCKIIVFPGYRESSHSYSRQYEMGDRGPAYSSV